MGKGKKTKKPKQEEESEGFPVGMFCQACAVAYAQYLYAEVITKARVVPVDEDGEGEASTKKKEKKTHHDAKWVGKSFYRHSQFSHAQFNRNTMSRLISTFLSIVCLMS